MSNMPRLFVDMDGTLAEWRNIQISLEEYEDVSLMPKKINELLATPGYFYSLQPHKNVVDAIKQLIKSGEIEVFILSCCLPTTLKSSPKKEKERWLKKYLPEIDKKHIICVPDGFDKRLFVPDSVKESDYLFDDYTHNLQLWEQSGKGIKLLNNVNSNRGTWKGNQINFEKTGIEIADNIKSIIMENKRVRDENPRKENIPFDYQNYNFEHSLKEIEEYEITE